MTAPNGFRPIQIGRPLGTILPVLGGARALGVAVEDPDDLHVTLMWSRTPVDWSLEIFAPRSYPIIVEPQEFGVARLGNVVALTFESPALRARHQALHAAGARSDHPQFIPHISLGPWTGTLKRKSILLETALVLGPEYRKPAKI